MNSLSALSAIEPTYTEESSVSFIPEDYLALLCVIGSIEYSGSNVQGLVS
jgi:hypothetical protein